MSPPEPDDILQTLIALLTSNRKPAPRILAPAALWGFSVDKKDGDDDPGVTVEKVLEGSPAETAGMKAGDRLLTLDGRWTDSIPDTYLATMSIKPGAAVPALVRRKDKELKLTITPKSGL